MSMQRCRVDGRGWNRGHESHYGHNAAAGRDAVNVRAPAFATSPPAANPKPTQYDAPPVIRRSIRAPAPGFGGTTSTCGCETWPDTFPLIVRRISNTPELDRLTSARLTGPFTPRGSRYMAPVVPTRFQGPGIANVWLLGFARNAPHPTAPQRPPGSFSCPTSALLQGTGGCCPSARNPANGCSVRDGFGAALLSHRT